MIDINSILNNIGTMFITHYLTIESDVHSILFMKRDGGAFARMYWYDDDNESVYLDSLSVNEEYRNQRIGTELQLLREDIAIKLGFKNSYLVVDKCQWMKKWNLY